MKIYINDKEIETEKPVVTPDEFMQMAGHQQLVTKPELHHFRLEVNNNFYDDIEVNIDRLIELKDGQRYKVFPKAGVSPYSAGM